MTGLPWTGIAITLLASTALGDAIHQFVVLGVLDTRSSVAASARRSVGQLRGGVASFVSSEAVAVAAYLDRCTEPDQRVLVTFFAPEIPYVARRGFAAGHLYFVSAYFSSDEQQRAAVERLARQNVPVALLPQSTYDAEFTVESLADCRIPRGIATNGDRRCFPVARLAYTCQSPVGQAPTRVSPCFRE